MSRDDLLSGEILFELETPLIAPVPLKKEIGYGQSKGVS